MHSSLGKISGILTSAFKAPRSAEAPQGCRLSIRRTADFAKAKSENAGAISLNGSTAALTAR